MKPVFRPYGIFPAPLRKSLRYLPSVLLACAVPAFLFFPGTAAADALTAIANEYRAASAGWMSASLVYALRLFYLLLGIELAASAIGYLFYKENLADFFAALLIKLLALLFFWVLIEEAPVWIPAIINSFTEAGAAIGGTAALDPSSVFGQGITVATAMLASINDASVFNSFLLIVIAGLSALGVVLAYAVIAAQLLVTLVESYLVIGGGALMLGFAGSRWTLTFTERYLGYAVSVGIKLFVLYLIIGLGGTLAVQWAAVFTSAQGTALPQPQAYLDVVGGALVFMFVGWQVPSLASSLMMGSPSLTFGGAATTTALLSAAMANAVLKSFAATASTAEQSKNALTGAANLARAAIVAPGQSGVPGAAFAEGVKRSAGDIRPSAREKASGQSAPGRGTTPERPADRLTAGSARKGATARTKNPGTGLRAPSGESIRRRCRRTAVMEAVSAFVSIFRSDTHVERCNIFPDLEAREAGGQAMNRSLVMPMTISFIVLSVALLLGCTVPLLPSMPSGFSGVPDRLPRAFPSSPERIGVTPPMICDRAAYEAGFRTQYVRHWNWVVHDKEVLYQVKSRQHPGDTAARRNYALYRGKEMSGQDAAAGNYGLRLDASGTILNDCEARSFTQGETAGMREAGRDLEKLAAEEL